MYREQNYIFSFTFVYKPKMASLIKITKKEKKKQHKAKHTHKKTHKNKELRFSGC